MTKYEFIKAFASACAMMAENRISPADYRYIGLVEDLVVVVVVLNGCKGRALF